METLTLEQLLLGTKKRWLVTGAAGFIGSHLVQFLLENNQEVVGLDNFFTGQRFNLDDLQKNLSDEQRKKFQFVEGDIRNSELCLSITKNIDIVLHQAAVGSVPRSIAHPHLTFETNINGFFQILNAVRINQIPKFVFASSSSVYGDIQDLVKIESRIGVPLSPYGWSKQTNETLAANFRKVYGMDISCLRYFNVFGPRQNPKGEYAAVIPKWIKNILYNEDCEVFGDGLQARDFCYIKNVIEANVKAGLTPLRGSEWVFNIAYGGQTSLLALSDMISENLKKQGVVSRSQLQFKSAREGDIKNSLAHIGQAKEILGYSAYYDIQSGLKETVKWYVDSYKQRGMNQ